MLERMPSRYLYRIRITNTQHIISGRPYCSVCEMCLRDDDTYVLTKVFSPALCTLTSCADICVQWILAFANVES